MTKEELDIQKEIEKYFIESTGFGRDKLKNFIDIVNKALKQKGERIAELENKIADIKANCDYVLEGKEIEYREERKKLCYDFENMKATLESKIAEQKAENELIKNSDSLCKLIGEQKLQIEKMKCCINDLVHLGEFNENTDEEYLNYQIHEALKQAEQFLKEIEK